MIRAITIAAVALSGAAALSGCGGTVTAPQPFSSPPPSAPLVASPKQIAIAKGTAATFLGRVLQTQLLGEFNRAWPWLDPIQRDHLSRDAYLRYCEHGRNPRGIRVVDSQVVRIDQSTLHGVPMTTVTLHVTLANDKGREQPATVTAQALDRGDHWTWILNDSAYRAIDADR